MTRITLIILTCLVLGGLNSSRSEDSHGTSSPAPTETTAGPAYETWKSCVELFYPKGVAAISAAQAPFAQPKNIPELLQNLQLVWKQDLLLQQSFYDPATLRRVFGGSAVSWEGPSHPLSGNVGFVVAQLDSGVLPGITVRAESRCWRMDHKPAAGPVVSKAYIVSAMTLSGKAFPGMDLRAIRAAFGPETVNAIDTGDFDNGVVSAPVGKGSVAYANRYREKTEGRLAQRITFYFARDPSQKSAELRSQIVDEDVVRNIEMSVSRHLQLEN